MTYDPAQRRVRWHRMDYDVEDTIRRIEERFTDVYPGTAMHSIERLQRGL